MFFGDDRDIGVVEGISDLRPVAVVVSQVGGDLKTTVRQLDFEFAWKRKKITFFQRNPKC